ncbi:MAG TPA: type II toxin-antitoxin system VapC family toxin [Nitrososphaerales archaeon]|nr:type II toxin-antitoxin system VapC family toxin [Nitrososphaerales archaeon]
MKVLLDTSALVAIFTSKRNADRIDREVGDSQLYVSHVQLAEVADWATRSGAPAADRVEAVEQMAIVVPLTKEICLDAAAIKSDRRKKGRPTFGIIDGIILATARSLDQSLITFDSDFDGEGDCAVLQ